MKKTFFAYEAGNSFFHKLDPRVKIIALMTLSLMIFGSRSLLVLGSFFMVLLIVISFSGIRLKKLFRSIHPMVPFIMIVFLLQLFFVPNPQSFVDESDIHVIRSQVIYDPEHDYWVIHDRAGTGAEGRVGQSVTAFWENRPEMAETAPLFFAPLEPCLGILSNLFETIRFLNGSVGESGITVFQAGTTDPGNVPRIMIGETHPMDKFIFIWGPIQPSLWSLYLAVTISLKFITLLLLAALLTATTPQSLLIQAIDRLISPLPLKRTGLTSHDVALMTFLTIRFIPHIVSASYVITAAAQSRGLVIRKSPFRYTRILSAALVGMIIDDAGKIAMAMENRGYGGKEKTFYHEMALKKKDAACLAGLAVLFASFVISKFITFYSVSITIA